ncbi:MAG: homocysteine S-methyltransferase family protein [bacterium]
MEGILKERLALKTPLILSGAMGTELERRNVEIGLPYWSANALIFQPEVVQQIHEDYIEAGADIIVTNTFRTNRRVFKSQNLPDRSLELTTKAVELAKSARDKFPKRAILIAGCVAPVEDCYKPGLVPSENELNSEQYEMVTRLVKLGVDFLLIETMTTIREAYAAAKAAKETDKEFIVSFACQKDGTLYGGEQLTDAVNVIAPLRPTLFSLNCISPRYLTSLVQQLKSVPPNSSGISDKVLNNSQIPFAVYGNVGNPDTRDGKIIQDVDEDEYVKFALEWKALGASIIGGCCGTTPEYIRRIVESMNPAN